MEMPESLPNNNENSATHQHHGLEIIEVREQNGNQENNIEIVNQHLGNSSGNNKRRRKESKVWEEMTRYEGKDGKVCAKCTHCEKEFDGSSKKGTTHLKNHLERCPVKRKNGGGDADKSMKTTVDLTSSLVFKDEPAMDLIKNFLWNRDSSALNSRKIEILQVYKEEKEKLRQFLDNLSCRFSLRIGLYCGFCVLTVHYIDDSWELRWKIISLNDISYQNLVAVLKKSCLDLKIDGNICSTFYDFFYKDRYDDGGEDKDEDEAYDDAIGEINSWLSQRTSLSFGGSLIANRQFLESHFFYSKNWDCGLSLCIDHVNSTASNKRKFEIAVDNVNSMGKKVMTSDDLPWEIDDVESFGIALGYKEVFCELEQIDPDFKSINLTKEEWDDATIAYEYFKELKSSILSLRDTNYTTPNMYFPKFCDVYIKLLQRRTSEGYHPGKKTSPQIEKLASSIQQKFFDRYWSKCNLVLVITAILDPRFKLEIVQRWYKKIYGIDADSYLKKINDDFIDVYNEYARCGSAYGDYSSSFSYLDAMGRPRTSSEGVSSKSEVDRYLKDDPKCPPYEKFDILVWWRVNAEIYPTLARMARDFLAMPIHFVFPWAEMAGKCVEDVDNDISSALVCLTNWLKEET